MNHSTGIMISCTGIMYLIFRAALQIRILKVRGQSVIVNIFVTVLKNSCTTFGTKLFFVKTSFSKFSISRQDFFFIFLIFFFISAIPYKYCIIIF